MDVTLPDGRVLKGVPEGTTKAQLAAKLKSNGFDVPNEWMAPTQPQQAMPASVPQQPNTWGQAIKNVAQAGGHFATSLVGGLVGDVAGLGALGYDMTANGVMHPFSAVEPSHYADPASVRESVARALTYTPENQDTLSMNIVQAPGKVIGGAGDYLKEKVTNIGGQGAHPYAGDVAGAVPLAVASLLGLKASMRGSFTARTPALVNGRAVMQTVRVPVPEAAALPLIAGENPAQRAENFVRTRTNLSWDRLSEEFRRRLTEVAGKANNLEQMDATAVERQGLLASLERPITSGTRGQLTRDPLQQRTEQLLKSTDAGKPLRDIDIEQNRQLLDNLDALRGRTGARANGELQTGRNTQDALRSRLASENARVRDLYDNAEAAGEMEGPVNIDKLVKHLKDHDDPAQVSYATSRLKQLGAIKEESNGGISVETARPLTLKQLEGVRRAAVAAGKNGGTAGHYASQLKSVIDDVTDGAGGAKYKEARAARRAIGDEFERQAAVARLVKNRKLSSDRAVALEDTWHKTVYSGSLEDLQAVRASLEKTDAGRSAWNDLKAATVDYIKDSATSGKLGIKNQAGDLSAAWAGMKRAVDDIGPDKMREVFGAEDARKVETLAEAAQILKTEAPMGVKGSPTADKILTFLDRIGKVPGLGKTSELASGAVKLGSKIGEVGRAGREVRRATTSPIEEALRRGLMGNNPRGASPLLRAAPLVTPISRPPDAGNPPPMPPALLRAYLRQVQQQSQGQAK